MRLFPTIAAVASHPEFLRPLFGTTCGTECGFGTLGELDLAFSPECPGSSQQLHRGGLPCPDHPLYSCVRFLILPNHSQEMTLPPDSTYQSSTLEAAPKRTDHTDTRRRGRRLPPNNAAVLTVSCDRM